MAPNQNHDRFDERDKSPSCFGGGVDVLIVAEGGNLRQADVHPHVPRHCSPNELLSN